MGGEKRTVFCDGSDILAECECTMYKVDSPGGRGGRTKGNLCNPLAMVVEEELQRGWGDLKEVWESYFYFW